MAATATLATTTLLANIGAGDSLILLGSTSGVMPGVFLFIDGELTQVLGLGPSAGWVSVKRGQDGTSTTPHGSNNTVYIGRGDQFYSTDPIGPAPGAEPVSPYINLRNGSIWYASGDETGPSAAARVWRRVTTTPDIGALGVRTSAVVPTGPA